MQTLLTGFGAFERVVSNPTERLVRYFEENGAPGHALTVRVLPVSYESAGQQMRAEMEIGGKQGKPFDCVLMLGVASGCKEWRVERIGWNSNEAVRPDAFGRMPSAMIAPHLPESLLSTLPHTLIAEAIRREGLPVVESDSAGRYLCNYVLFSALAEAQKRSSAARIGFLHVPADEQTFAQNITSAPSYPFAQHILAVRAALNALHPTT